MKNNKKGFTLVELLAVIVILAIIALIATPIILNVIDNAKEGAAKNSAYGYIDALEKANAQEILKNSEVTVLNDTYTISESGKVVAYGSDKSKTMSVNFKGDAPTDGGTLTYTNGKLTGGSITVSGKAFSVTSAGELTKSTSK